MWNDLPEIIGALFIGATALTAALAVGARIAFKPIMESWLRLRQTATRDELHATLERRIGAIEGELEDMRRSIHLLVEAEEFRRQLESARSGEAPSSPPRLVPTSDSGVRTRG